MTPMSDPRDYKLELSSLPTAHPAPADAAARPYLSVLFACCGVYRRIYRDPAGQSYSGHCPRCAKSVRFPIAQGGTRARFFRVS